LAAPYACLWTILICFRYCSNPFAPQRSSCSCLVRSVTLPWIGLPATH
jgi:hypothetical protein